MKRIGKLILIILVCCCGLSAQMQPEDEMFGYVTGIEGKSHQDRAQFIKNQLKITGCWLLHRSVQLLHISWKGHGGPEW